MRSSPVTVSLDAEMPLPENDSAAPCSNPVPNTAREVVDEARTEAGVVLATESGRGTMVSAEASWALLPSGFVMVRERGPSAAPRFTLTCVSMRPSAKTAVPDAVTPDPEKAKAAPGLKPDPPSVRVTLLAPRASARGVVPDTDGPGETSRQPAQVPDWLSGLVTVRSYDPGGVDEETESTSESDCADATEVLDTFMSAREKERVAPD